MLKGAADCRNSGFKILKNSARNCTLKVSDIRAMGLFLNAEKSRSNSPGPVRMFLPAFPRRLKHSGKGTPGGGTPGGLGSQLACQKASEGALGMPKHSVLM